MPTGEQTLALQVHALSVAALEGGRPVAPPGTRWGAARPVVPQPLSPSGGRAVRTLSDTRRAEKAAPQRCLAHCWPASRRW